MEGALRYKVLNRTLGKSDHIAKQGEVRSCVRDRGNGGSFEEVVENRKEEDEEDQWQRYRDSGSVPGTVDEIKLTSHMGNSMSAHRPVGFMTSKYVIVSNKTRSNGSAASHVRGCSTPCTRSYSLGRLDSSSSMKVEINSFVTRLLKIPFWEVLPWRDL